METKEKEYKLSEDSAREQIQKLMDSYDIDENDLVVDQGPEAIKTILNRLVRAVRTGQIEVKDDGSVVHVLAVAKGETTTLTYRRLRELRQHREELFASQQLRQQQMELFKFQADEIDAAELQPNQAAEVQTQFVKLSNVEKLKQDTNGICDALAQVLA